MKLKICHLTKLQKKSQKKNIYLKQKTLKTLIKNLSKKITRLSFFLKNNKVRCNLVFD